MDIERMTQMRREAEDFARLRLEKIEAGRAVMTATDIAEQGIRSKLAAERRANWDAEDARLEELRPHLEEQARKEHSERFKPLQELLSSYEEPVRQIRDVYFPESKIGIADHYDNGYSDVEGFDSHNV